MIKRKCKKCGKVFETWKCKINVGRGKYCSKKCSDKSTLFKNGQQIRLGKNHSAKVKEKISLSRKGKCLKKHNPRWKGGKYQRRDGYVYILVPQHPHADCRGYIAMHRLVMEKHIGRYLFPTEVVHHNNGQPSNNRFSNLHNAFF